MTSVFDSKLFTAILGAKGIQILSQSITILLLIALANEKSVGQFDYYLALISTLTNISLWGQDSAISRSIIDRKNMVEVVANSAVIQLVQLCSTLLACLVVMRYLVAPLGIEPLHWMFLILVVPACMSALATENILNVCRWTGKNKEFMLATIIGSVVPVIAVGAGFIVGQSQGIILVFIHAFGRLLAVCTLVVILLRLKCSSFRKILINQSWFRKKDLLRYSVPMGAGGFLLFSIPTIERLAIYSRLSFDGLAIWSISGRAMIAIDAICGSIAAMYFQTLHLNGRSDSPYLLRAAIKRYIMMASITAGLFWIIFFVLSEYNVFNLYVYKSAMFLLIPLSVSAVINGATVILSSRLSVRGRAKPQLLLGFIFSSLYISCIMYVQWKGNLIYPACFYLAASLVRLFGTLHFVKN